MRILPQKIKHWFRNSAYLGLTILFISAGVGCASTQKTTTTETTVTTTSSADQAQRDLNKGYITNQQDKTVGQTSTTTTEAKTGSPGILSSTLHAIGYVIAIPFIIIGGLFKMIFGG